MDITENLSIDASSILMNFSSEDDFFNPINNSSINDNDDFDELMKHIESTDDFIDSNADDLLALTKNDMLSNDIQDSFSTTMSNNIYDSTMDYLNKPDNQYISNSPILQQNVQQPQQIQIQPQEMMMVNLSNNMNTV